MLHSDIFYAFLITAISLTVVVTVLARLRVPSIVGFVATGILIGPSGLNWISSLPAARTISELGVIFLMFALGLEISLEHLRKMFRPLLALGLTQVVGTIAAATLFFHFVLGFPGVRSFVFGTFLSLSSTAIVLKLLHDMRETETPHGRVSITVLLFQDIAALPLMVALPLLATDSFANQSLHSVGIFLAGLAAFFIGCLAAGYYLIPRIFAEVTKTQSREVFFFLIVSFTFIIAFLAEKVGLSMSLGAFLAGVLISESPYSRQALAELSSFRDIFLGFFFASVGMLVDIPFVVDHFHILIWLIPVLFVMKFLIIYLIVRWNSHSHGVSFASALGLTQIGEFSFILGATALSYKLISDLEFQYFLVLAVFSLLFTPLMLSFGIRGSAHSSWRDLRDVMTGKFRGPLKWGDSVGVGVELPPTETPTERGDDFSHGMVSPRKAIVIGLGHAGKLVLEELTRRQIPCLGIDFNLEHVQAVRRMGIEAFFGDGTRHEVLEAAGIQRDAFLVVITVSGKQLTSQIHAVVTQMNPKVKVLVRVHFLRDLSEFREIDLRSVVVSEAETARALIARSLVCYGLESHELADAHLSGT